MTEESKLWLMIGLFAVLAYQAGSVVVNAVTTGIDSVVEKLAYGIALAEGFFLQGSRPQRNHNPGDLTEDITGRAAGRDGPFIVYANDDDGWDALRAQVRLMFSGSHIYNPSMTIQDVASHYTTTQQDAWAFNVASSVGVPVDTRLQDIPT